MRIQLNSAEIDRYLQSSPELAESLKSAAEGVEGEMQRAIESSNSEAKANRMRNKGNRQKPFSAKGENTDRQTHLVGIESIENSDWIFGTLQKAVERFSGKGGVK